MLSKLEKFKQALDRGETPGSLRDRFHFTRHEKSRSVALRRIHKGIKGLERLLGPSTEMFDLQNRVCRKTPPAKRIRRFSDELYKKLARYWPNGNTGQPQHMTRLCLWNCCCLDESDDSDDSLDMIVSVTGKEMNGTNWQESVIKVKNR